MGDDHLTVRDVVFMKFLSALQPDHANCQATLNDAFVFMAVQTKASGPEYTILIVSLKRTPFELIFV
jgi:hypothetical protein